MTRRIEMDKLEGFPVRLRSSSNKELRRLADFFKTNASVIARRGIEAEIKRLQEKEQQTP